MRERRGYILGFGGETQSERDYLEDPGVDGRILLRWIFRKLDVGGGTDCSFGGETQSERDHLEDPGVDGRIILRWIFRKFDVGVWTGSIWLWVGTGGEHL